MRLLTRISVFCIAIGLVIGLFLRARIKNLIGLIGLSFLPWLVHLIYIALSVLDIPLPQLGLFIGANLLVLLGILAVSWSSIKKHRLWLAFLPIVQGFIYSLSLLWFIRVLALEGLGLNSLSWVAYAGAALVMSGMLLGYMFRLPLPKIGSLINRRPK